MKKLVVLACLLIVTASAQARTVPSDSLEHYLSAAKHELSLQSGLLLYYTISDARAGEGDSAYVASMAEEVIGASALIDNIAIYFAIANKCGFDGNVCNGISFNCKALESIHGSLEHAVLGVKEEKLLKQLWTTKVFIHYLLIDIADSVSDKECLKEMRKMLNLPYYDPSVFGM